MTAAHPDYGAFYRGRKQLVTGGLGLLGSSLAHRRPALPLRDGLSKTIAFYRANMPHYVEAA